jgi:hypothetical protein
MELPPPPALEISPIIVILYAHWFEPQSIQLFDQIFFWVFLWWD